MPSPPIPAVSRGDARSRTAVWVVVAVVGALGAASLAWIYGSHLSDGPPIRTNGAGYYVYLPAVFIDHDLTLRRTLDRRYGGPVGVPGVRRFSPGREGDRLLDKYPVGEAIMLTPFFAVGEAVAVAGRSERDGYSRPYQAAAAAGGLVYTLLGLAVLGHVLLRWFSRATVVIAMLATTLGASPVFALGLCAVLQGPPGIGHAPTVTTRDRLNDVSQPPRNDRLLERIDPIRRYGLAHVRRVVLGPRAVVRPRVIAPF